MADTDTSTATPPAAPPPTMGDSLAGITALNKQYQPQLGAAEQSTLDYMKQGAADRAPLTADVNKQEAQLSSAMAKAPAPEKEPDAPDLKFKKVSLGALLGTIAAGLVAGRAAKTGPMLTAAASLNALVAANNTGEQNRIAAAEKDYDAQLKKVDRHNADMRQQFDDITNLMKTNVTLAKDRLDSFNAAYTDGLSIHTQQAKSLQQAYTIALHGVTAQLDAQKQLQDVQDSHARLGIDRERLQKDQERVDQENHVPVDLVINGKPHKVLIDRTTGDFVKDLGEAGKPGAGKMTVAEEKATTNYVSMDNAEKVIEEMEAKGVKPNFLATVERDDNGYWSKLDQYGRKAALTPDEQVLAQASAQFAEGAGHLKSGARINQGTMNIMNDLYLHTPGDSPELVNRKTQARQNDIHAARIAGGSGAAAWDEYQATLNNAQPAAPAATAPAASGLPPGFVLDSK